MFAVQSKGRARTSLKAIDPQRTQTSASANKRRAKEPKSQRAKECAGTSGPLRCKSPSLKARSL